MCQLYFMYRAGIFRARSGLPIQCSLPEITGHLLEVLNYRIVQIKLTVFCVCKMIAVKTTLACHIV